MPRNKLDKGWRNVSIRVAYIDEIKEILEEKPELRFKSISHFVNEAVKDMISKSTVLETYEKIVDELQSINRRMDELQDEFKYLRKRMDKFDEIQTV